MVRIDSGASWRAQAGNRARKLQPLEREARDKREAERKRILQREREQKLRMQGLPTKLRRACPGCGDREINKTSFLCRRCDTQRRLAVPNPKELHRQLETPYRGGTIHDFEWRVRLLEITRNDVPL